MNNDTPKAGTTPPDHEIGSRTRRAAESTYGLPNHKDGIQSGDLTGGDRAEPATPADNNTLLTGPGATHSNGMKGQK